MKLLSSQEAILGEREHQNAVSSVFEGHIRIHGNSFFEMPDRGLKDSTGLARQIVKFTCNTIPATPNSQLPMLLEKNLVRIIWSALTCDLPPEDFLGGILSLNEVLDQDVENEMRGFILNKVYANEEALTALGAQETRPCIPCIPIGCKGCMERPWAKARSAKRPWGCIALQCRRGWGPCIALQCNLRPLPVLASRRDAWNALGVALQGNAEGGGGPLRPLPL